jgi:DNA modification methylase
MTIVCTCAECGRDFDAQPFGGHRLMCGDSTDPDQVATLAAGALADLCFTSPPYGQQRDYKSGGIADWDVLMQGVFAALPVKHEAQVLVNLGMVHRDNEWLPYWQPWIGWMRSEGWRPFGWYVWDQGPGLPGDWNGRLAPAHEFIFHFNRAAEHPRKTKESKRAGAPYRGVGIQAADGSAPGSHIPGRNERARKTKPSIHAGAISDGGLRNKDGSIGGRSSGASAIQDHKIPDSVIRVTRHKGGIGKAGSHPAVFPVALVAEMLTAFSDAGDVVFEPFCGSGTQLIAAQANGRVCLAMELAPAYADVAVRRWSLFTGRAAVLEANGMPFPMDAAE